MNRSNGWRLLLGGLLLIGARTPTYSAEPDRPISIVRSLIDQAVKIGQPVVVIPPGIYRGGPPPGNGVVLTLNGASNLKIVANGVTMICTVRTRALEFDNCRNVEVDGLSIDYDPLTFTQGAVTAVAPDNDWIDVTIDAGYPVVPFSRIDIVDPTSHYRMHGMPFLWGTTATVVASGVVRVSLPGIGAAAPIGSLASLSSGNDPGGVCHAIDLENCRGGIVLRSVTIYCAPGMGIVEHGGVGGTKLLSDRIIPGPLPAGATAPRLLTTSWDGILHSTVGKGPDVENCTIENCGDDSWSIQSSPLLVVQVSGGQVLLAGGTYLSPGDHLFQSLSSTPLTVQSCTSVPIARSGLDPGTVQKLDDAPQWSLWSIDHDVLQVLTLDGGPLPAAGTSFYCPEHQGNGFVFRDNYVHSSGRLLIKASDGLIEGNEIIDGHNVVVDPEVANGGAYGISDITFRNNKIVGADNFCNTPWSSQAGALSVVAGMSLGQSHSFAAAGSYARIDVYGNTFTDVNGANIALAGISGFTIADNKFVRPQSGPLSTSGAAFGIDQTASIFIRNCDHGRLQNNTVTSPGPLEKEMLNIDGSEIQRQ